MLEEDLNYATPQLLQIRAIPAHASSFSPVDQALLPVVMVKGPSSYMRSCKSLHAFRGASCHKVNTVTPSRAGLSPHMPVHAQRQGSRTPFLDRVRSITGGLSCLHERRSTNQIQKTSCLDSHVQVRYATWTGLINESLLTTQASPGCSCFYNEEMT